MGRDGVDLRNDIGVQISYDGKEIWRECSVCEKNIDIGDEVLYLYRQRGTASATSGYVHLSCMEKLKLDGQTGDVLHYGRLRKVQGARCTCAACGEKGPTYVGLTKQRKCVGFHWKCVKDVRLTTAQVEEKRAKRAAAIPRKVVQTEDKTELKKWTVDAKETLDVSVFTRHRISGKLVSASCYISLYDYENWKGGQSESIDLFSRRKWQRKKGELRLTLILHWPIEVQKQVLAYFDQLQERYDEKGYLKVVEPASPSGKA